MAILDSENVAISEDDSAANRVCPVTVKLTQDEHREVTEHVEGLGQARSESYKTRCPSSPRSRGSPR